MRPSSARSKNCNVENLRQSWHGPFHKFHNLHTQCFHFISRMVYFRRFSNLFFSVTFRWIPTMHCLVWVVVGRILFEPLFLPFFSCENVFMVKFAITKVLEESSEQLADAVYDLRRKCMKLSVASVFDLRSVAKQVYSAYGTLFFRIIQNAHLLENLRLLSILEFLFLVTSAGEQLCFLRVVVSCFH